MMCFLLRLFSEKMIVNLELYGHHKTSYIHQYVAGLHFSIQNMRMSIVNYVIIYSNN